MSGGLVPGLPPSIAKGLAALSALEGFLEKAGWRLSGGEKETASQIRSALNDLIDDCRLARKQLADERERTRVLLAGIKAGDDA